MMIKVLEFSFFESLMYPYQRGQTCVYEVFLLSRHPLVLIFLHVSILSLYE